MTLREKQSRFARMLCKLINYAHLCGYELTLGYAYRCEDCQIGHRKSLHKIRLAQDLNLFRGGKFLTAPEEHLPLGEFWESMGGTWGGRFDPPDGNHYSLEHNGMR